MIPRNISYKEAAASFLVHSHGIYDAHCHDEKGAVEHQQPIENEQIFKTRVLRNEM